MQIYHKKDQAEQGKFQNAQFEEKRSIRKCNGRKSSAKGEKKFKEKSEVK